MTAPKEVARCQVDRHAEALISLSERLHADPDTAWEEHGAAAAVPESLAFTLSTLAILLLVRATGVTAARRQAPCETRHR